MITAPQGAEREQLAKWATPRLLRYLKSRRARLHAFTRWNYATTVEERQTIAAMEAEIDRICGILGRREHVQR